MSFIARSSTAQVSGLSLAFPAVICALILSLAYLVELADNHSRDASPVRPDVSLPKAPSSNGQRPYCPLCFHGGKTAPLVPPAPPPPTGPEKWRCFGSAGLPDVEGFSSVLAQNKPCPPMRHGLQVYRPPRSSPGPTFSLEITRPLTAHQKRSYADGLRSRCG
jgi:hypothetical protein